MQGHFRIQGSLFPLLSLPLQASILLHFCVCWWDVFLSGCWLMGLLQVELGTSYLTSSQSPWCYAVFLLPSAAQPPAAGGASPEHMLFKQVCCLSLPQEKHVSSCSLRSALSILVMSAVPTRQNCCRERLHCRPQIAATARLCIPASEGFSLIHCCYGTSDMSVPSPLLRLHKNRRALVRPNHSQDHSPLQEAFCSFPVTPTDLIVEVSAGVWKASPLAGKGHGFPAFLARALTSTSLYSAKISASHFP